MKLSKKFTSVSRRRADRGGFTLIELLVTIAIIAILASLILPALSRGKGKAQSVKCLSTLRQWGLGMQLYATDAEDTIPRDGTDDAGLYAVLTGNKTGPGSPNDEHAWFNVLPGLMGDKPLATYWNAAKGGDYRASLPFPGGNGKIWHCPTAKAAPSDFFLKGGTFGMFSYVMNLDLKLQTSIENGTQGNTYSYPHMPKLGTLRQASSVVLMVDAAFSPTKENYTANPDRNGVLPATRFDQFAMRHNETGANLVFTDGHASFYKRSYILSGGAGLQEKFNPDVTWNPNRETGFTGGAQGSR